MADHDVLGRAFMVDVRLLVWPWVKYDRDGFVWQVWTETHSEDGWESTRLKAWHQACAVARRDFG